MALTDSRGLSRSVGAVGMGASSAYWMLVLARGVNGVGLGMIGPVMYGMVVDAYPPTQRGQALGILGITGSVGGLVCRGASAPSVHISAAAA